MMGRIDKYRCSTNPRSADVLYFCFENNHWTIENAFAASKAFTYHFNNATIDAYRVLEPTSSDVRWRLIIEALFANEHERRQIIYQSGGFQQNSLVKSGMIVFKNYEDEQQGKAQRRTACGYLERDPDLVLSLDATNSSFMTEETSLDGDDEHDHVFRNNNLLRAHVFPALPKVPEYTRYVFRLLPLDSPGHAQSTVQKAIVQRYKQMVCDSCKIKEETNEDTLMLLNDTDLNSTNDVDEASIINYIMDIFIETPSTPATSINSTQQLWVRDSEVINHSAYYSGSVCIVLKNPLTLYDESKCRAFLEMYGGQTFYSHAFSHHYLYCERCQSIDIHGTSDCPTQENPRTERFI